MKKTAYLILGSCIALGSVPRLLEATTTDSELPVYHLEAAHSSSMDVAHFVRSVTADRLPQAFHGHSRRVARALISTANKHQMDPLFLMAVIQQESRFNPLALGSHGEVGLMQIKPSTVRWMLLRKGKHAPSEAAIAKVLRDPVMNIRYGAQYMAFLRKSFKGRRTLYISAYNMGAAKLRTQIKSGFHAHDYSDKVMAGYYEFAQAVATQAAAQRAFVMQVVNASRFPANEGKTFAL